MKNKLFPFLLLTALVVATMSTSWSQSAPQKPADSAKAAATAKMAPAKPAIAAETDRKQKAAQTTSNMVKKSDQTAKDITGNLK